MEVVLSGDFTCFPRDQVASLLTAAGNRVSPAISKKTSILLIGVNGKELKLQEAELRGIPIVPESFLAELLRNGKDLSADLLGSLSLRQTINKENKKPVVVSSKVPGAKRKLNLLSESDSPSQVRTYSTKKARSTHVEHTDDSSDTTTPSTSPSVNSKKGKSHLISSVTGHPPLNRALLKKVIALEGEIGVGKSTLSQKMLHQYSDLCGVYEEQTNQGFLKLFYGNPSKYGFAFQWGMLKTRIYQLKLAQHDQLTSTNPPNKFFVWDRSMIGDYIFALWNHLLGSISIDEMKVYESEFGGSILTLEQITFMSNIHLFVFLNDEPAACKYRVEEHRKHESEQGIPLPYYQGIDDIHFSILISILNKRAAKAIVLNWGEYEDPHKVLDRVGKAIEGENAMPIVDFVSRKPAHPAADQLLYTSDAQIQIAYENIRAGNVMDLSPKRYSSVYIPRDGMLIDPRSKNVVEEHRARYNIQFHENAYKRVVMWHISQFQNVFFY